MIHIVSQYIFDSINLGCFIVHIKGSQVRIFNYVKYTSVPDERLQLTTKWGPYDYGKISNTSCLPKRPRQNSADPDQTASEEAV